MWIVAEISLFLSLVGIDLFSKWAISGFLASTAANHFVAIDGILEFTYVENNGASFGVFSGNRWLLLAITALTALAILVMLFMRPKAPKLLRFGLVTLLGGAIGNIYDRAVLGYVRDFIDYTFLKTWFNIDFAIGNIADIFCLVAVLMILVYVLFGYKEGDLASHKKLKKALQ